MRKTGFLLVVAVFLNGCATMAVSNLVANNSMNLVHLSRGMSKAKVLSIMGSKISVYNCDQAALKIPPKVTISNPYRTEMIETSGRTLEIIYYVTSLNNNNCVIEEDELTPLVFEDARLIGWGKNFLLEIVPVGQKPQVQQKEKALDKQQTDQGMSEPKQADQAAQVPAQKIAGSAPGSEVSPEK